MYLRAATFLRFYQLRYNNNQILLLLHLITLCLIQYEAHITLHILWSFVYRVLGVFYTTAQIQCRLTRYRLESLIIWGHLNSLSFLCQGRKYE